MPLHFLASCRLWKAPATHPGDVFVGDRVGDLASLLGRRPRDDRITLSRDRRESLPTEDLAQPPVVAQYPREAEPFDEVRLGGCAS